MKWFHFLMAGVFAILILNAGELLAQKQKIILDTDIGGDIDDAFALALILSSPEFDLLGVTVGHGLTEKRAQVACRLLYEAGREDIPVAVGRETANVVGESKKPATYTPQFYWAEGFEQFRPIKKTAADFIIEMLHKYPHEIVIFTIGPVTNMGEVVRKDSQALKLAKHIYSMFGSFYMGYGSSPIPSAEWNVRGDVESSKLFASSGADITYAGLDVTTFVKFEKDLRLKLLMRQSPLTNALCGLYSLWGIETPVLYDVVAVGMFLWPELFDTRAANVRITDKGFTVVDESKAPNCEIGLSINKKEFLNRIMQRYLRQNLHR